jgi:hypothetical protein
VLGGTATGGNACDDGRCRDGKGRRFYLSRNGANGAQASSACAHGFHMTSLFEILDPSHLEYDTVLGLARPDSGKGPPTGATGWIRTGYDAGGDFFGAVQGKENCGAGAGGTGGQIASLVSDWSPTTPNTSRFAAWDFSVAFCNSERSVWCVQD